MVLGAFKIELLSQISLKLIVALCQKVIDPGTGVLETQRKLAEIVEMIHTAQVLNSNV